MKGARLNHACHSELPGKNTQVCRHSGILLSRIHDILQDTVSVCKGIISLYVFCKD